MHYLSNLQNRVNVTGSSFCLSLAHGTLLGSPVLVVASGIGPGTAALCTMELLQCRSAVLRIAERCGCSLSSPVHNHMLPVHFWHMSCSCSTVTIRHALREAASLPAAMPV